MSVQVQTSSKWEGMKLMAYKEKCTFNLEIDISNLAILSIYCVIYEKTQDIWQQKLYLNRKINWKMDGQTHAHAPTHTQQY